MVRILRCRDVLGHATWRLENVTSINQPNPMFGRPQINRKFRRGDRVRPIKPGIYWSQRQIEGRTLAATVTAYAWEPDHPLDTIHVRYDDGDVWVQVFAEYFEPIPDPIPLHQEGPEATNGR